MGVQSLDRVWANSGFPIRYFFILTIGTLCWAEPFFLPENSLGGMTGILVQGHFLLGYLYQYKTGKMNQGYALRYVPVALLLFGACFFLPVERLIGVLAAAYFLIHFFYDERYLLGERAEFSGWKIVLPTIGLLFAEILYRYAGLQSELLLLGVFTLGAAYLALLTLSEIFRTSRLSWRTLYFLATFSIAALLTLSGKVLPGPVNPNALHFLFLIHVANWYWRYIEKFNGDSKLTRKFIAEMISVNAILGALMFFRFHPSYSVLLSALAGVFFLHPYFQVWTLLHFVATYRTTDIMNWVPARNSG